MLTAILAAAILLSAAHANFEVCVRQVSSAKATARQ